MSAGSGAVDGWAGSAVVLTMLWASILIAMHGLDPEAVELLGLFGVVSIGFGALAWVVIPTQPHNAAVWTYAWAAFFGALGGVGVTLVAVFGSEDIIRSIWSNDHVLTPSDIPLGAALGFQLTSGALDPDVHADPHSRTRVVPRRQNRCRRAGGGWIERSSR